MSQELSVLHINSYYSTSHFYRNLFDLQVEAGLQISVYVPVDINFVETNFDYKKYTLISKCFGIFDRLLFYPKHNKIVKDIEHHYDSRLNEFSIIHAHSLFSNGYTAYKLHIQYDIPYLVTVRNTDLNVFFKYMIHMRSMGIRILENASHIVFLSESYRKQVFEKYIPSRLKDDLIKKTSIIPNGIDEFWFENRGDPKQKPSLPKLKILQVGDINKNKNVESTVAACKLLIEKGYTIELNLVGKIKNKSIFAKVTKESFVNYLGFKGKQELLEIYRKNDIFVLPSHAETFGLVYVEAMSQGLPIIYAKGQGFDKQFQDGEVGFASNSQSPEEIAYKIESIVASYEEISKNCIDNLNKYKWKAISGKYYKLYLG
ncbi:MAG: glycosyltransferase family 4 protein [Bacteroidales bacterium]|nr:glycosyltransferase family 4 protein [Bacteroidales bacterium]